MCVCVYVCACVYTHVVAHMLKHMCGSQRTTFGGWFLFLTCESQGYNSSCLCGSLFYSLSPLASLIICKTQKRVIIGC